MSDLEDIIERMQSQIEGGFSEKSDALTALYAVIELAKQLMKLRSEVGLA